MLLDDDNSVYFGQHQKDIENIFSIPAIDSPSPIARKGVDKQIKTKLVSFQFDNGILKTIEFGKDYRYTRPPKPYEKTWKNFVTVASKAIKTEMSRGEFVDYLCEWERRAQKLGATKVDSGDLKEDQYRISFSKDKYCDMIQIAMGVSRRAAGGGIWADGWTASFTTKDPLERLQSLTAFSDQFNTVARR